MSKEIIERLSKDRAFGILTRNALELEIEKLRVFDCCFIDFNSIKKLNQLLGYRAVNKIIFEIFVEFKQGNEECIIGRWFSGDEVVFIHSNIEGQANRLDKISKKHGMTFKKRLCYNVVSLTDLTYKIENGRMVF